MPSFYLLAVTLLLLCMMLISITALYSDKGDVIQATAKDFKDIVLKDKGIVIVEFYSPW
jgi:hypothetical protein